jgi:hypothetical protein
VSYRPYPDAGRALRQVERTRAAYEYGRVPQRYALGAVHEVLRLPDGSIGETHVFPTATLKAFADALRQIRPPRIPDLRIVR